MEPSPGQVRVDGISRASADSAPTRPRATRVQTALGGWPTGVPRRHTEPCPPPATRSASVAEAVRYLAGRSGLLVVDNCEHAADAAADAVSEILDATSDVSVLATSRELLGLDDERSWPVPSLGAGGDAAAIELFLARAAAAGGPATLPVPVVASICEALDGLPLAIDLAAARTRSMSVEEVRERFDDRFRLLRGSGRRTRRRQQTLEDTVRWSYELLTHDERQFLLVLGVFLDGFRADDAAAVAGLEPVPPWIRSTPSSPSRWCSWSTPAARSRATACWRPFGSSPKSGPSMPARRATCGIATAPTSSPSPSARTGCFGRAMRGCTTKRTSGPPASGPRRPADQGTSVGLARSWPRACWGGARRTSASPSCMPAATSPTRSGSSALPPRPTSRCTGWTSTLSTATPGRIDLAAGRPFDAVPTFTLWR